MDPAPNRPDGQCEQENPPRGGTGSRSHRKACAVQARLHEGYSDLNPDEEDGRPRYRQTLCLGAEPPRLAGFRYPCSTEGRRGTSTLFSSMENGTIFAIDPNGEPYLASDAGRMLLSIRHENGAKGRRGDLRGYGTVPHIGFSLASNVPSPASPASPTFATQSPSRELPATQGIALRCSTIERPSVHLSSGQIVGRPFDTSRQHEASRVLLGFLAAASF